MVVKYAAQLLEMGHAGNLPARYNVNFKELIRELGLVRTSNFEGWVRPPFFLFLALDHENENTRRVPSYRMYKLIRSLLFLNLRIIYEQSKYIHYLEHQISRDRYDEHFLIFGL